MVAQKKCTDRTIQKVIISSRNIQSNYSLFGYTIYIDLRLRAHQYIGQKTPGITANRHDGVPVFIGKTVVFFPPWCHRTYSTALGEHKRGPRSEVVIIEHARTIRLIDCFSFFFQQSTHCSASKKATSMADKAVSANIWDAIFGG